jgi:hypothetical protein
MIGILAERKLLRDKPAAADLDIHPSWPLDSLELSH